MQAPVARHSGISIHPLKSRQKFPNLNSDRKSTRLNSSHLVISYAVFCLKKKKRPHDEKTHSRSGGRRLINVPRKCEEEDRIIGMERLLDDRMLVRIDDLDLGDFETSERR